MKGFVHPALPGFTAIPPFIPIVMYLLVCSQLDGSPILCHCFHNDKEPWQRPVNPFITLCRSIMSSTPSRNLSESRCPINCVDCDHSQGISQGNLFFRALCQIQRYTLHLATPLTIDIKYQLFATEWLTKPSLEGFPPS